MAYKSLVQVIKEHNTPVELTEVQQKEVDALKKLSKDMQAVLKGYQKIAGMGDKELKDMKYNKDYEAVLKSRDTILQLIGKVNTQKILNKEEVAVDLEEKLGFSGSYQRKSKFDGKEFDRNKEIKQIAKIKKVLEQADKLHADLQYPYVVDTVTKVWDKINDAYTGLINYEEQVKKGEYDGTIDMDD